MLERLDHHGHGGDPCLLERSCDVSDRHVTDWSHGNEEHRIYLLILDPLNPRTDLLAETTL
jgi:hypothetical protein